MTIFGYVWGDLVKLIDGALTGGGVYAQVGTAAPTGANVVSLSEAPDGTLPLSVTIQINVDAGTVSAFSGTLLNSNDGVNFYPVGAAITDLAGGVYPQSGIVGKFWSFSIATVTVATGTPAVTVYFVA